jgi:hypothetical protein
MAGEGKSLKDLSDADKAKAFDMIINKHNEDNGASGFGMSVDKILIMLREYHFGK